MIPMTSDNFGIFTPNKRKLSEERDDDAIVTPSSSYGSDIDDNDNDRDNEAFISTPCPTYISMPCESPSKRRRTSAATLDHSKFSPPLMPRFKYRPSTLEQENGRSKFYLPGRPVLDLFTSDSEQPKNNDHLSFLAIPTPPSNVSEADTSKIPSFGLSPRTTTAPLFPLLLESRQLFGGNIGDEKENESVPRRRMLPPLSMRPQKQGLGKTQLMKELSLPTLFDATRPERRSSISAVFA